MHDWVLSLATFTPLIGAVVILLTPKENETLIKSFALITTLATAAFGVNILLNFDYDRTKVLQFSVNKEWIEVIGSRYHIGVDGLALPLLILSMFICILCVVY